MTPPPTANQIPPLPSAPPKLYNEEPRQIIVSSFAPRVAVYASEDTDSIAREKGFEGIFDLLRPFGEKIQGKVVVRDSGGASRGWEDFSIRIIRYGEKTSDNGGSFEKNSNVSMSSYSDRLSNALNAVVDYRLQLADEDEMLQRPRAATPAYAFYLRKLLADSSPVPYETISHPVACIIAVSSRDLQPLEKIRELYSMSGHRDKEDFPWIGAEYLRYYVLVHDEDIDDITKSTALFDLMKRHFGLHCHLLRLRSTFCVEMDDNSSKTPECLWLSAQEDLVNIEASDRDEAKTGGRYVFESDMTAIKALIREMVTQSLVPFMEGRIMTWNDQVASRRRGIGGRFMSLSKRWTNFGVPKGSNTTTTSSPGSNGSNFNSQHGYYPPQTPEATMRQMADYAFMLRDWRLAYHTYDFLRTDFASDKAWAYHASACELAALSFLLLPQGTNSRTTSEAVDQHVEAALFSYLTRCSMPSGAIRCLTMTIELLMSRGSGAAENASSWAIKLLELGILTPLAQAFLIERIADCHQCQDDADPVGLHQRKRQIAFWKLLASQSWVKLQKPGQASARLQDIRAVYGNWKQSLDSLPFPSMHSLFRSLDLDIQSMTQGDLIDLNGDLAHGDRDQNEYEQSEQLNLPARRYSNIQTEDSGGFATIGASHPGSDELL